MYTHPCARIHPLQGLRPISAPTFFRRKAAAPIPAGPPPAGSGAWHPAAPLGSATTQLPPAPLVTPPPWQTVPTSQLQSSFPAAQIRHQGSQLPRRARPYPPPVTPYAIPAAPITGFRMQPSPAARTTSASATQPPAAAAVTPYDRDVHEAVVRPSNFVRFQCAGSTGIRQISGDPNSRLAGGDGSER